MTDTNLQQGQNYSIKVENLPHIQFNAQRVSFPGVQGGQTSTPTPFQNLHFSGDSFDHDPLVVDMILNEDLSSYYELVKWVKNRTISQSYTDYNQQANSELGLVSTATIQLYTSANNPSRYATFTDLFPLSVGGFTLDSTETDIGPITFQVVFQYQLFDIK